MWEDRETFSPPAHLNYQYHFEDTPREAAKAQRFSCLSPFEAYFLQSAELRPIFSPVENYGHMRGDGVLDWLLAHDHPNTAPPTFCQAPPNDFDVRRQIRQQNSRHGLEPYRSSHHTRGGACWISTPGK